MNDVVDEIKVRLWVREVLDHLGTRIHPRSRADCPLCSGTSQGTLSYTDELWHCFRCDQGGSVFDLVMAAHGCNFRAALEYLAVLAGVQLPSTRNREEARRLHCEYKRQKKQREQLDRICDDFAENERALRRESCRLIHICDRMLSTPGPWAEQQWSLASMAHELRDEYLLPEYMLLAFGAVEQRMKYARANELERIAMSTAVRWAGGVRTDDEKWVEAMQ